MVNIFGDYINDEFCSYVEFLQDEIEILDEILEVEFKGVREWEVKVDIDLLKMEFMQVIFWDIENVIILENIMMFGGELFNDDFCCVIWVKGEFEDVFELEEMIVKSENQCLIYLWEIVNVIFGYKDFISIVCLDGFLVIFLDVIKWQGENFFDVFDKIKVIVDDVCVELLEDLKISLFNDQFVNICDQVSNFENSIIFGVILVVVVLLFFLGLCNVLFVGFVILLFMFMGILFLLLIGVIMNIVVFFVFILVLGFFVDNVIVVVENIY